MVLWSAKVPKALSQSGKVAPHLPILIKKTAALCFVRFYKMKVLRLMPQNHCVLGLVVLFVLHCNCFFDSLPLGIDCVLR